MSYATVQLAKLAATGFLTYVAFDVLTTGGTITTVSDLEAADLSGMTNPTSGRPKSHGGPNAQSGVTPPPQNGLDNMICLTCGK